MVSAIADAVTSELIKGAFMETKTLTHYTKGVEGRTVVGIATVFGNVDHGRDRAWNGSFAKTLNERLPKIKYLWNHGSDGWDYFCTPPIARIDAAYEVSRDALPQRVLEQAPEATGGVEVKRTYLDTPRGNEILALYQAGIDMEMSYAYDVMKHDFSTVGDMRVRELREVKCFDFSDVNAGMNEATVGAKAGLERRLSLLVERMKTLQAENVLAMADESLQKEFFALCKGFGELQAKETSRAEPLIERVSLTPYLDRLRELELALVE
jgi:hypothetical protein